MENTFPAGSVPVRVAARVYGKDANWVRTGIVCGWLPIGTATRRGEEVCTLADMTSKLGRINYYISPRQLWEHTGFRWNGEKE